MFFFHFVLQDELIASKVILLPCKKLIVRVSCLLRFFENFSKMELAHYVTERRQRYKIMCFSPNSSHFNHLILKIAQYYDSPLKELHLVPHMWGEL